MSDRLSHAGRGLREEFFARSTPEVARDLLGAVVVSRIGGKRTAGVIVETEAYLGADDPGSHAATRGITARNRVMYGPPGRVYVYFTYGNHHMLNLVTEADGVAGAVLVRAIEPTGGVEVMRMRRGGRSGADLTNGPGKVAEALGISLEHNGIRLGGEITIERAPRVPDVEVVTGGRIGLTVGHDLLLRFCITGNGYVSKGKAGPKPGRSATARKGRA